MEINEKIKALREDYDLTQSDIAKTLGTSYQYYQKYEKGKHPIPIQHLKTLCKYYHISANYLLDLPETYDRTKEEILERKKNKDRIDKEKVEEIIRWAYCQGHVSGDIDVLIKNIYDYEED